MYFGSCRTVNMNGPSVPFLQYATYFSNAQHYALEKGLQMDREG